MSERLREVFVVDAVRTQSVATAGPWRAVRPDNLGAVVIADLDPSDGANPASIDDVQLGCANRPARTTATSPG